MQAETKKTVDSSEDNFKNPQPLGRWQFSLLDMLVGTGLFATVLGCTTWKEDEGATISLFFVGLFLAGVAFYKRRKGVAIWALLCFVIAFLFVPFETSGHVCAICGKGRLTKRFAGITWQVVEEETELSTWCMQLGWKPHAHRWEFLYRNISSFAGTECNADGCVKEWQLLKQLYKLQYQLDKKTFDRNIGSLIEEFHAAQGDEKKLENLSKKCDALSAGHP
jgi:hypothetical protein